MQEQTSASRRPASAWRRGSSIAAVLTLAAAGFGTARFDLEVAVPPGSPLEWGRSFPAITPERGPLFPVTPMPGAVPEGEPRSQARPRTLDMDLRLGSSFALVRILTWDLTAHISWLQGVHRRPPTTGSRELGPRSPEPGEPLYWITLAPLLRLALHPGVVSRDETVVHMLEIGEPALPALETAKGESSLRSICSTLTDRIDVKPAPTREPLTAATPRETMLSRFVLDELVAAHPYDPAAGFGRRVFAFSEELEPLVAAYVEHEDPFTRRNATAALGRYHTRFAYEQLLRAALTTEDMVVFVRALAALPEQEGGRSAGPLVERLERSVNDVERTAIIGALGRLGAGDAAGALVELGGKQLDNPDLLLSILTALVRIPHCDRTSEVVAFARRVEASARRNPQGFKPRDASPEMTPDRADPPGRRGELILQLALMVRFRHDATDPELEAALLALSAGGGPALVGSSAALGQVLPPAQGLYLEALARLGQAGQDKLIALLESPAEDPSLRGRALAKLPWSERRVRAVELLDDETTDGELQIHALEVMVVDRHPELIRRARLLLMKGRLRGPGSGGALERHLQLVALRALRDSKRLSAGDLLPLLDHPRADRQRLDDQRAAVQALVSGLVSMRAAKKPMVQVRKKIDELLLFLEEQGITDHLQGRLLEEPGKPIRRLNDRSAKEVKKHIERTLEGVRRKDWRVGYEEVLTNALMDYLFGYVARTAPGVLAPLEPPIPFEEEILFALGRSRDPQAVAGLIEFLEDRGNGYRAFACLALGMAGDASAAVHLVPLLQDPEPFVRFCAYESLRHLTGEDHFVDWIYGEPAARVAAMQEYARWCRERR